MLNSAIRFLQGVALIGAVAVSLVVSTRTEAADVDDVLPELRRIAKEEAASPERLLERAAPVVAGAFQGRPWNEVEAALEKAGLAVTETDHRSYNFRCVVLPAAWSAGWGVKFDLYVGFSVPGGRPLPTYTIPQDNTVTDVEVGLTAKVSALHEEVRKQNWFGAGTFIQEALSAWPVAETLAGFPILHAVDLSFAEAEPDDNANGDARSGFGLRLDFVDRKGEGAWRRRLECFADLADQPGGKREPIRDWQTRDFAPRGAATALADDLAQLLKEKETSYQRILWKATHLVQRATLDRELKEVESELNTGPLKPLSKNPWQYGTTIKYLVAKNASATDGGQALDLLVELQTYRVDSKTAPTREVIRSARALFRAEVRKGYREVVDKALFGRETAVHATLGHEDAVKVAQKFGFVGNVEVGYDLIGNRWTAEDSWGFHVNLEFHPGPGDESAGARHFFTVPSLLDPPQTGSSSPLVRNFVPYETFGGVSTHGSNGWSRPPASPAIRLTKKGSPKTRKPRDVAPRPTVAHGVGDLAVLPADTRALDVENQEVYDHDLAVLARFTELETLDLGTPPGITDEGLRHLSGLKKLKSLTLNGEVLTGTGFRRLVDLPELRELTIYNGAALTNQGAAALAELKQLAKLRLLRSEGPTEQRAAELAKLKGLRELDLWWCTELTDAGLRHLSTLPNLESLTLTSAPQLTPAGIAHLAGLTKLAELKLSNMSLTDAALPGLSRIASLEYVELRKLDVTLAGLKALSKLPQLKRLAVYESKKITEGDEAKLKALLPGEFEKE